MKKTRVEITEALKIDFAIFAIEGLMLAEPQGPKYQWASNFFPTSEMLEFADLLSDRFHHHQSHCFH
jgi:hypothetical protein